DWAFGAGMHAVTFVSKVSDEFYIEHSFSYYTDTDSFDLTPRHDALPMATLHQAMGQPIKVAGKGAAIAACFRCHSTGPVSVSPDGGIAITEPGIRCEACHGGGNAHQAAAASGDIARAKKLISKPGDLSAAGLNSFCGECHRMSGDGGTFDWESPWSVRHQ